MPLIESLIARKIVDSRGSATVEVDVRAGARGRAAAPSGASTGTHEAQAWPAGGVDESLRLFQAEVVPRLKGHDVADQAGVDGLLSEIDGTPTFGRIGGNLAVAVSLATAKAAAAAAGKPLFRYLGGPGGPVLPFPMGNIVGGGRHAIGGTTIQEIHVVAQSTSPSQNVFANARVHRLVMEALAKRFPNMPLGRGDEGAWIARMGDEDAVALVTDACKTVEAEAGFPVRPSIDFAASEYYREGAYHYADRTLSPADQIEFVEHLVRDYGLFSVEDPLDEDDFDGFAELTKTIGAKCTVIGDDIFVTNRERLGRGIERRAANAILIKPNQIGTLTETRATVDLATKAGFANVVSHRSGETTDETIAHLAVAFGSLAIKSGAVGGERIAKLNELIRIEEELRGGT
jgi:enolase